MQSLVPVSRQDSVEISEEHPPERKFRRVRAKLEFRKSAARHPYWIWAPKISEERPPDRHAHLIWAPKISNWSSGRFEYKCGRQNMGRAFVLFDQTSTRLPDPHFRCLVAGQIRSTPATPRAAHHRPDTISSSSPYSTAGNRRIAASPQTLA